MKPFFPVMALVGLLLNAGCVHATTRERVIAVMKGSDREPVKLVERQEIKRRSSLLTPEGPVVNHAVASISRYFILKTKQEFELRFLEAKDEYRPAIWALDEQLWLAHVIPESGSTELVLFESNGNIVDRHLVCLPDGRAGGIAVSFHSDSGQLIFEQKGHLFRFAIRDRRIASLDHLK